MSKSSDRRKKTKGPFALKRAQKIYERDRFLKLRSENSEAGKWDAIKKQIAAAGGKITSTADTPDELIVTASYDKTIDMKPGQLVNATDGLTLEKILEAEKNFYDNEMAHDPNSPPPFVTDEELELLNKYAGVDDAAI